MLLKAADLIAESAMTILLKNAMQTNLVQTLKITLSLFTEDLAPTLLIALIQLLQQKLP